MIVRLMGAWHRSTSGPVEVARSSHLWKPNARRAGSSAGARCARGVAMTRSRGTLEPCRPLAVLLLACALVAAVCASLGAQTASAPLTVAVTVVRSCSVSTEAAAGTTAGVRLSCGGQATSASLTDSPSVVAVLGAAAGASVSSAREPGVKRLTVNF
jgi:hypothetical protein